MPGDPTQTYLLISFCHSIAQFFGNVNVCKGLEVIGRRKNIDFLLNGRMKFNE